MAQVNLKVFNKIISETRRFSIDESLCSNFMAVKEKIQLIFPNLRGANFRITWKDNDGDFITVTGDEDLIVAFTEMSGSTKVLYIDSEPQHQSKTTGGCPLGGETFDFKNVHALGELAKQYLEPIMGAQQAQSLMATLGNAATGLFGTYPESTTESVNSAQPKPSGSGHVQTDKETEIKTNGQKPSEPEPTAQAIDPKIAKGLAQLHEMGFNNDNGFLTKLLEYLNGDIEGVIRILANK